MTVVLDWFPVTWSSRMRWCRESYDLKSPRAGSWVDGGKKGPGMGGGGGGGRECPGLGNQGGAGEERDDRLTA